MLSNSFVMELLEKKGQSYAEFLFLLPSILLLCLGLFQLALLINAHQSVKLAAYKACRSLIVNINKISFAEAELMMKRSTFLSLINISPPLSFLDFSLSSFKSHNNLGTMKDLSLFYATKGYMPQSILKRYVYATKYTKVFIEEPINSGIIKRGTPVKVRVDYLYHLNVPFAGRVIHSFAKDPQYSLFFKSPIIGKKLNLIKISKSVTMQSEN